MKKIIIGEHFKNYYLTSGVTRDNFVFENCMPEFMAEASKLLGVPRDGIKVCNIIINKGTEDLILKTLEHCEDDIRRKLLVRDFLCAKIMYVLLWEINGRETDSMVALRNGINAIIDNNWADFAKFHPTCPMPHDITNLARKLGKIELNIFLYDCKSAYLQQAINNFISSREPYSVKVFTTKNRLASYCDQVGNIIECPHDFMQRDVRNFVQVVEANTEK